MLAVIALCKDIFMRHAIHPTRVLAHSDIAPERKIDPGEKFDWARLHVQGIGHWVKPEPIEGGTFLQMGDKGQAVEALQAMLQLYGYRVKINGLYDDATQVTVRAFQRHFRPSRVDGIADSSTVITLRRLMQDQQLV
jgi:N-acetylmuramoyl-L-alanine amidase